MQGLFGNVLIAYFFFFSSSPTNNNMYVIFFILVATNIKKIHQPSLYVLNI
ncbi:hypothetical protein Hdeb2414_s0022g00610661 [Helianthus debilis subsp. tardiflorus]